MSIACVCAVLSFRNCPLRDISYAASAFTCTLAPRNTSATLVRLIRNGSNAEALRAAEEMALMIEKPGELARLIEAANSIHVWTIKSHIYKQMLKAVERLVIKSSDVSSIQIEPYYEIIRTTASALHAQLLKEKNRALLYEFRLAIQKTIQNLQNVRAALTPQGRQAANIAVWTLKKTGPPRHEYLPEIDIDTVLHTLSALVSAHHKENPGTPFIIALAGVSCSGKSTAITKALEARFKTKVLNQDNYYIGKTRMAQARPLPVSSFDDPRAIDTERMGTDLERIKHGEKADIPVYSMLKSEPVGTQEFNPAGAEVIIVEGLYALDERIRTQADFTIFVTTDMLTQLARRTLRDVVRKRHTPHDIIRYMFSDVIPLQYKHVTPQRQYADAVVSNNYNIAVEAPLLGTFEAQAKIAAPSFDESMLERELGAVKLGAAVETDMFYVSADARDDRPPNEFHVRASSGNGRESLSFIYKGPDIGLAYTCTPYMELPLDPLHLSEIEKHNIQTGRVTKARAVYQLNDTRITVDRLDGLGTFVEVTSIITIKPHETDLNATIRRAEESIIRTLTLLGLKDASPERSSYIELLRRKNADRSPNAYETPLTDHEAIHRAYPFIRVDENARVSISPSAVFSAQDARTLTLSGTVIIEAGAQIEVNSFAKDRVCRLSDCRVGPRARVRNCALEGVWLKQGSQALECKVTTGGRRLTDGEYALVLEAGDSYTGPSAICRGGVIKRMTLGLEGLLRPLSIPSGHSLINTDELKTKVLPANPAVEPSAIAGPESRIEGLPDSVVLICAGYVHPDQAFLDPASFERPWYQDFVPPIDLHTLVIDLTRPEVISQLTQSALHQKRFLSAAVKLAEGGWMMFTRKKHGAVAVDYDACIESA